MDFDFAKEQLLLMLRNLYFHPNGQIPAYEWNFSDVNPPVHAWATLYLFKIERTLGRADLRFLERSFQGLMLNFNWWVNRKDPDGRNVFAGGFLGLDNIGVFDRSAQLPTGGSLEQADGTAWMAFYCQSMLEIALILCEHDPMYEEVAFKFVQHFMWISYAMDRIGEHHDEMWDEQDGFFYDLLRLPDGQAMRLKVRSLVGLLPLCASTVFEADAVQRYPKLMELIALFRKRHPEFVSHVAPTDDGFIGYKGRRLLSILNKKKLERVLAYMLDENEFLGPHGIRSLSRYHLEHPFVFHVGGQEYKVQYLPGESNTGMFGGNSNWRGPVWMPVNALMVRALLNLYSFYGDEFKVQCPTGSGQYMTLFEVAQEISRRLASTFLRELAPDSARRTAGLRRDRQVPGRSALARSDPVLRILPRRQRSGARRQPPDGVDRSGRPPARPVRAGRRQRPGARARANIRAAREGAGGRGSDADEVTALYQIHQEASHERLPRVVGDRRGAARRRARARLLHVRVRARLVLHDRRPAGLRELPRHERAIRRLGQEQPPLGRRLQRLSCAAQLRRQVATKAHNGFWHSYYFTSGTFPEPIRALPASRNIAEANCRRCHEPIVQAMGTPAHVGSRDISCIRCHGSVGHMELGATNVAEASR